MIQTQSTVIYDGHTVTGTVFHITHGLTIVMSNCDGRKLSYGKWLVARHIGLAAKQLI